jgi:tRNA (guanine-N7-)-methyltransferase
MARRLKTDIPGIDRRITVDQIITEGWPGIFAADLAKPLPLVVELGFGRGEFLVELARAAPDVAHVGVEISRKRVLKMARRVARLQLSNIRLVHGLGELVVRDALPEASVRALWINFSDPWPKKRHHRRRLIQRQLLEEIGSRLAAGGVLHIATDDVPYARHIDALLREQDTLENRYAPDPWRSEVPGRPATAYELAWRAEGRPLHFWAYQKVGIPPRRER